MSRVVSSLKDHFFQQRFLRRGINPRRLWLLFAIWALLTVGTVAGPILSFYENPTSLNPLTIGTPAIVIGIFLLFAAELVARVRLALAGVLRIAAYILIYGIGGISLLIWLIDRF